MASIYKPTYTKPIPAGAEIVTRKGKPHARYSDRHGKTRTVPLTDNGAKLLLEQKTWRIEYTDANGLRKRAPGFTDLRATEQRAAELERRTAHEQTGLVDRYAEYRKRPLAEHVSDWYDHFVHKGTTQKQAGQLRSRVLRVIDGCGFAGWPDLSASKVQAFVAELQQPNRTTSGTEGSPKTASVQTKNFYLQAIKQFCRWMVQDGRAPDSPLAHLTGWNVRVDRRHDRRAFTDDELTLLLEATQNGPTRFGMTGAERALLYRLAVETGLRAGEIKSLTTRSFDLDGTPPTVSVNAAYSKRRREDVQPLRRNFALVMAGYLRDRVPDAITFNVPEKTAKMLRADLADARTAWIEAAKPDEAKARLREDCSVLAYRDEAGRQGQRA